ncbi:MAG TPA: hypothetical protein ENJ82_01100, partial [Bacteroidetes bacterium]|nr:hypothetical protein [Bacteroidota bacterium]
MNKTPFTRFIYLFFSLVLTSPTLHAQFSAGNILVASSVNARVYEFDPAYNLVSSWTHPSFGIPGQALNLGPNGMVFDNLGNLVVAGRDSFCVFSTSGTLLACHAKVAIQATENVIFDFNGNLYTTTSTIGGNQVHKYDQNYNYITTFSMPTGQLTGITCDTAGNLYIASQVCSCIYKVDATTFTSVDVISGFSGRLEGLQMDHNGNLLVAQHFSNATVIGQILRINAFSPLIIQQTISTSTLKFPVPLTIDNAGNIYTADYEN